MNKTPLKLFGALIAAGTAISLSGCASQPAQSTDAKPSIVTTTNVWGDIAQQIAGGYFDVTSLISDPAVDPHSYEATARDQLAITEAELFIINGGGYDEFAEILAGSAETELFNVYEAYAADKGNQAEEAHSEEEPAAEHEEHSEDGSDHTWYDLHLVEQVSAVIAIKLGELQPENAAVFLANAESFGAEIALLETKLESLGNPQISYFEAHPLATMLLSDLGFKNLTPEGFAAGEEAGLEPSASMLADSRELIASSKVQFLAVNAQVTSPTLDSLKKVAADSGVPVLEFDELLPEGSSYQEWMATILDAIASIK